MAMMMALMLCVGLLAGCGGSSSSSGGGSTGGGDAGGAENKEVVDVTVTVWGPQEPVR